MSKKVPLSKHIETLQRRMDYLQEVISSGDGNSYDRAEIAALRHVIALVTPKGERRA